jgi:formate hydrogenlyase subunit 4
MEASLMGQNTFTVISLLSHLALIFVLSPFLLGVIGKTKALFAGRWGPPLFQPYYDIAKLFRKGCVYSGTTTWVFRAAPMIALAAILTAGLLIPLGGLKAPVHFWGDILLFAYLFALARFFIILAALDTGSSFEGMGASREAAFSCLSEVTLFLNFTVLVFISKNLSLSGMIGGSVSLSWHIIGPALTLVVISFFLILLCENSRIPVDDPATHLELTMIHEVMVLDHSGVDLAYILYGKAVKLFVLGSVLISIILPFRIQNVFMDTAVYLSGMTGLAVVIGVIESAMARLRLNRVPYLLISAVILAVFALIIALVRGGR